MNIKWFQDPNHIVPIGVDDFVKHYQKKLQIDHLRFKIEEFRQKPNREGKILSGGRQTSVKLFLPKLVFGERMEKDENVWVYFGADQPCFCLEKTEPWRDKAYFCFSHRECEYYPCHKIPENEQFNCLFCFCPLYSLGRRCGGNFRYHGSIKDCSGCVLPHLPDSYGYIMSKFNMILESMSHERENGSPISAGGNENKQSPY